MHRSLIRTTGIIVFLKLCILISASAQIYQFRNYGLDDGLPHGFVYTVNQDSSGFIWIGTGTDLARFNGFEFESGPTGDSLPSDFARISFRDSQNRLWFGHNNGSISVLAGNRLEILDNQGLSTRITGITEDSYGNILISSQQHGLVVVDSDMNVTRFSNFFAGTPVTAMAVTGKSELLVGSFEGLYRFRRIPGREPEMVGRIEGIPAVSVETISCHGEMGIFVGTGSRGLFHLHNESGGKYHVTNLGGRFGFGYSNVQSVYIDRDTNIWAGTSGHGVYKINNWFGQDALPQVKNYSTANGLAANHVYSVFQDIEGNYWFATLYGLSMLPDESFSFLRIFEEPFGRNVSAVYANDSWLWLGGESGLLRIDRENNSTSFYGTQRGLPFDRVTALTKCNRGDLWIGTDNSGIYRLDKESGKAASFHLSANSTENSINHLLFSDGILLAATNGGVFEFKLQTGEQARYTTMEGLPRNNIYSIFKDNEGITWAFTRGNRLANIQNTREIRITQGEIVFVAATLDQRDRLWIATERNGIIKVDGDSIVNIIAADGLHSNFCYSITSGNDGNIWVGHKLGLSRVNPDDYFVRTYSTESGIRGDFNLNAVHMAPEGTLLFGTTGGLVSFDPSLERSNRTPPMLNITSVTISDEEHEVTDRISLPYGSYKFRIDFVGLNFKSPEKVTYQYKLEGYDLDWSDISNQQYAYYSRVDDGNFSFLLRAYSAEGMVNETPLALSITIATPIWKRWYFYLGIAFLAVLVILVVIKLRERNLRLENERIERELVIRTKEVMEQKREIEYKNRDITDSINYAQRIQASILPPFSRLEDNFAESFVFYQPRDIVSGDFYWFDRVNESKFLIVCADSTGHGVPGAFMSMIGTTLIKDICIRPDVKSPSEILETLDREVANTLNQNVDNLGRSTDGMDLTVCEFDIKRNYLRFSSAMRPIMIFHKNELMYIRGSRNSIGGYATHEKSFENREFQLDHGDLVYLFSDGYPDQFGGPHGKKFKMMRLKNLLQDICHKPLKEQFEHVTNNFKLWQGDNEQVDDILFMGLKM